jgi:hypothetical protein
VHINYKHEYTRVHIHRYVRACVWGSVRALAFRLLREKLIKV